MGEISVASSLRESKMLITNCYNEIKHTVMSFAEQKPSQQALAAELGRYAVSNVTIGKVYV
jgi:hypothetical protein